MSKTYIVVGDSILSSVPQGLAKDLALNIVSQNRDVVFKSIAAPGNALGITDHTGFNNAELVTTFNRIGGMFAAYDGILVMAGVNDFNRNVRWEDLVDSLRRIMNHAQSLGKKVIVFDPIWKANENTPNSLGHTLNVYRYFQYLVCQEYPNTAFFASRSNTIMGDSAGAAYYDSGEVAAGTQTHPNVAGHIHLANWIMYQAGTAGLF